MARTATRGDFSRLTEKGFFTGRGTVKKAAKGFVVKVRNIRPPYAGHYDVCLIMTNNPRSPKNNRARVPYKGSFRDFPFEDLVIVSTAALSHH